MGLFDYMDMLGTYDQRKVANTKVNGVEIDTCSVTDSTQPFETGVSSKHYDNGNWIIVEQYDTKEDSIVGHQKWVDLFTKELPETLNDVSTCEVASLAKILGKETIFTKKDK